MKESKINNTLDFNFSEQDKTITRSEKFLSFAFCFILYMPIVNYYISFCLKGLGFETLTIIIYPLVYIVSIVSYIYVLKRTIKPIYFLLVFFFLLSLSVLFFPQNFEAIFTQLFDLPYNPIYRTFFLGFPLLFIPFVICNYTFLNEIARFFSRFTLLIADFAFLYLIIFSGEHFEYLTFSYYLLLPAVYCFIDSINNKNSFFFIVSVFSLFLVSFVGSRGALLSVLVFLLLYCIFFHRDKRKKAFWTTILTVFILITFLFYEEIIKLLIVLSEAWNFESRSLVNLLDATLFESEGRDQISHDLFRAIAQNIFGFGLYGDRPIAGNYAHNIFLEFLVHFGWLFGTILCGLYLYVTVSPIIFNKYKENFDMYMLYFVLFSSTFVKLMFSDSYLLLPSFWALVSISIVIIRSVK